LEATTIDEEAPAVPQWIAGGWRSVSIVTNDGSIVFCARDSAPAFIRTAVGRGTMKHKPREIPGNTAIRIKFADEGSDIPHHRSILSRADSALREALRRCGLGWSIDWSPDQDGAKEPEIVVCWGLIDPSAIDAALPSFRAALQEVAPRHQVRISRFGPALP